MRRCKQIILGWKSDKIIGQARAKVSEDVGNSIEEPLDITALGLDIWAQGVNPIVEYGLSIALILIYLLGQLSLLYVNKS
jgi:hypothetical protein